MMPERPGTSGTNFKAPVRIPRRVKSRVVRVVLLLRFSCTSGTAAKNTEERRPRSLLGFQQTILPASRAKSHPSRRLVLLL